MKSIILWLFEAYSKRLIRSKRFKIVAVTGSVGKTSTKLAIASTLERRFKVLAHEGNYNTETGLPLALFELEAPRNVTNVVAWLKIFIRMTIKLFKDYPYDVVVLEMGADKPGDIARFMKYVTPDIGVVTAVQPVHTELFGSVENIFAEKSLVARHAEHAVLNNDDDRLRELAKEVAPVTTYAIGRNADWKVANVERKDDGRLKFKIRGLTVHSQVLGEHNLGSLAAAAVVGDVMRMSLEDIVEALSNFTPLKGRMQLLEGKNGSTIIDDSYNASPQAVVEALVTLADFPGKRKIAILGNMNELGDYEQEGHDLAGRAVAQQGIDMLITIGKSAKQHLATAAKGAGLSDKQVLSYDSPYQAGSFMTKRLQEGDIVLVKGSQNKVFSEEATKLLLKNPEDARRLVRQSEKWQNKKAEQFDKKR